MKLNFLSTTLAAVALLGIAGCYKEDPIDVSMIVHTASTDPIDKYIQTNYTDKYGVAVRYKYVDKYVASDKRVTPIKRDLVVPMLEFLNSYWIEPFVQVANGNKFFKNHVPAEMVLIGSSIYNPDGTVTLGTADAGARITLTEANLVDSTNQAWVFRQLGTIYHEFGHIIHQRYGLPPNWQLISPQGYTSPGSWYTLSDDEALTRGFVSPYATSSFNEDFAETVAHILYYPQFYDRFYDDETCSTAACDARNEGRAMIVKKYNLILTHYKEHVGIDLLAVRELIQAKF
jgi:substrate import-associated zinc metallohydrolase lipoprotein